LLAWAKLIPIKLGVFSVLIQTNLTEYRDRLKYSTSTQELKTVGNHLISEILATVSHNLCVGATLLECVESESQQLPPDVRSKLALVHVGLAMALDALQSTELQACADCED
jgi:hypothetical protein